MELKQLTTEEVEAAGRIAVRENDPILFSLVNECLQHRRRVRGGTIWAESGVSAGTGQGFVKVTWQQEEAQLDPEMAKGLGQSIIDAAYSAEHDAYFVHWLHTEAGLSRAEAAGALGNLRAIRAERERRRPQ